MSGQSNADRQLEEFVGGLFKAFISFLKGVFRGIKKLTKIPLWIGLLVTLLIMYCGIQFKERIFAFCVQLEAPVWVGWMFYILIISCPALYLYVLGGFGEKSQQEYDQSFKDIGFVGRDGKYPYFCGSSQDGKKQILTFKSNIPIEEWRTAKGRLETALDYSIIKIEAGNSKKLVKLTVLPSDYRIPEKILWDDSFCSEQDGVITIGQSALGNVSFDLNKVPHVLIAGETNSGKSVILRVCHRCMVLQSARLYMIDFKAGLEFGKKYERYGEVITERARALEVLDILINEMNYRLSIFRDMEAKNLSEYNKKTGQNLCRIGVFVDEVAEMLDKKGASKEERKIFEALEGKLSTLARLSRAAGIHLFLGIQRPDANVLTGQIKNNIPGRISGRFADKAASEIVLGNTDAVNLPDTKGRFLYKIGNEIVEFQAFYFDDDTMLTDVDVEVGQMLTQPPSYNSRRTDIWQSQSKTSDAVEKAKATQRKNGRFKAQKPIKQETDYSAMDNDADAYPDWGMDEELPFPLDDEPTDQDIALDFDYS